MSWESPSDPFGDVGDDSVAAHPIAVRVGDRAVDAFGGPIVGPSHKSFAFKWGEAAYGVLVVDGLGFGAGEWVGGSVGAVLSC